MTTHERAGKMVAERVGFRFRRGKNHRQGKLVYSNGGRKAAIDTEEALWREAVRLQEELMKKEQP